MRHIRKIRRTIDDISIIFLLIIVLFIINHIDTILNTIMGLIILGVMSLLFCKGIKWLYYHLRWRNSEYNLFEVKKKIELMSPREFEIFTANIFNELGYKAHATEPSCDGGKDVIATDDDNKTAYIECKHYRPDNIVGRPMVQKLIGACIGDNVHYAIFITTSDYSNEAYEYAKKIEWLELWNMKDILNNIDKINKKKVGYVLNYLKEEN